MQTPFSNVQSTASVKPSLRPAAPLSAPTPLSPDLLRHVGGGAGGTSLPRGGW